MRQIQFESLLVKAAIFSLVLIMFIAVPWMEVKSRCGQGRMKGGATGAIAPGPPLQGGPRDEVYLFQIKYFFEKFRNSEAIQEFNSILYSYVTLSIKGTRAPNSNWFI